MNAEQSTTDETHTQSNGHVPEPVFTDAALAASITHLVETKTREMLELSERLTMLRSEVARYSKALALLTGEETTKPGPKRQTPVTRTAGGYRANSQGISDEKLGRVEQCIRELAADGDTFRQVDVRNRLGIGSGEAAFAFRALRDRNIITLDRQDGNNKWFALTRSAKRSADDGE